MRRFIILIAVIAISVTSFAVTEQEAREYFTNCISNLDPIEGCYSVEYRGNGAAVFGTSWSMVEKTSLLNDVYIVKLHDKYEGYFLVCIGNTENRQWDQYWMLERIGDTNAYKFLIFNQDDKIIQSCHIYLEKNMRFIVNYSAKAAGGYSLSDGTTVTGEQSIDFQMSFIKSYPSTDMYEIAQSIRNEESKIYASSQGTAFALKGGYLVTNYHVYGNKKYAVVQGLQNSSYKAYFVAGDETNDIAIFQIRDSRFKGFGNIPYSIATKTAEVGEEAWTLGFPETGRLGDEIKYNKGEINALSGSSSRDGNIKTNDTRFYQISTAITHGNSGGPLFDEVGQLIGVTSNGWRDLNNVNYAIKSQFILSVLESAGLSNVAPVGHAMANLKQKDQIRIVKPYIFRIVCYDDKNLTEDFLQQQEETTTKKEETIVKTENISQEKNTRQEEIKPTRPNIEQVCDTIQTESGEKIIANIVKVTKDTITYRVPATTNEQQIAKTDVIAIIFSDGRQQIYQASKKIQDITPKTVTQDITPETENKNQEDAFIYRVGKTYYYDGKSYTGTQYEDFLKRNCEEAYNQYLMGEKFCKTGYLCTGIGAGITIIGGILVGTPSGIAGQIIGDIFIGGGLGTFGCGILGIGFGINKRQNAYKIINSKIYMQHRRKNMPDNYINLQICQDGIGISLTF